MSIITTVVMFFWKKECGERKSPCLVMAEVTRDVRLRVFSMLFSIYSMLPGKNRSKSM